MAKTVKAEVIDLLKKVSKKHPHHSLCEIINNAIDFTGIRRGRYGQWSDACVRDALQKYLQLKD